ncbi:hypothetical protein [Muricoccus radiodurans]|uniref:hypothetical protein n=1 Tax=Muricoccus radiodurans TaxID=2231721 RepID=UPI003CF1EB38
MLERLAIVAVCVLGLFALAVDRPASRPERRAEAPPPTPAALATAEADRTRAAREEAARAETARLAAVQRPAESEDVLPEGHGRGEVFARCTACHSTAIIRRTALSRDRWDGLMDWMTEKHGMAPLEGEMRTLVVDYLAQHFPPRRGPRGGANPFLN